MHEERRWEHRPALAFLLRLVAFLAPVAASVGAALVVVRLLPPTTGGGRVVAWLVVVGVSAVVLVVVERLARRLLPLATLLSLSLLFPAGAPSRVALARRVGSHAKIQRLLDDARRGAVAPDAGRAAEEVVALLAALQAHDRRTRGHAERVRQYVERLGDALSLSPDERNRLTWGALLHDVGKLAVPADLLNKPARLTDDEWRDVRRHPELGLRFCAPLLEWLGPAAGAIGDHHERWDGSGYPRGLAGEEISLAGRIVAVADAYDVMTAPRSYRRPVAPEDARRDLAAAAGSQLDPSVVRAFLNLSIRRLGWGAAVVAWLVQLPLLRLPRNTAAVAGAGATTAVAAAALVATGVAPVPPAPADSTVAATEATEPPADRGGRDRPAASIDPGGTGAASDGVGQRDATASAAGTIGTAATEGDAASGGNAAAGDATAPGAAGRVGGSGGSDAASPARPGADEERASRSHTRREPQRAPAPGAPPSSGGTDDAGEPAQRRPNAPPRARDDTAETTVTRPVTIAVLANDEDPEGVLDPTSVRVTDAPSRGTATADADGTVTYTPDLLTIGRDEFSYRVCDRAGACAAAVVTVTVGLPVPDGSAAAAAPLGHPKDDGLRR